MSSKKMMRSDEDEIFVFGKEKFEEAAFPSLTVDELEKLRFADMQSLWVIGSNTAEGEGRFKACLDESSPYFFTKYEDLACYRDGESLAGVVPDSIVDLCLIELPTLTSLADVKIIDFFRVLEQACKYARRVFLLSMESSAEHNCVSWGQVALGSMLSAQWEVSDAVFKLLRIQTNSETTSFYKAAIVQEWNSRLEDVEVLFSFDSSRQTMKRSVLRVDNNPSVHSKLKVDAASIESRRKEVYLITGGKGSLGLHTVKALTECGVGMIVLISRSGQLANEDAKFYSKLMARKTQLKSRIIEVLGDVASEEDMNRVMKVVKDAMGKSFPKITGIIHAAGSLADGLLLSKACVERCEAVWKAKVEGIKTICKIAKQHKIRHVIAYSSIVSVIGNLGQCAYALANKCMEEILLQTIDFESCVIRWPGVIGAGMGKVFDAEQHKLMIDVQTVEDLVLRAFKFKWQDEVMTIIPLALLKRLKESILRQQYGTVVVGIQEEEECSTQLSSMRDADSEDGAEEEAKGELSNIAVSNVSLSGILDIVRNAAAGLLLQTSIVKDQDQQPLLAMGMDSISAAEFAIELGSHFHIDFPPTLIYSYPSIQAIADFIQKKLSPSMIIQQSSAMHNAVEKDKCQEFQGHNLRQAVCPFSKQQMPSLLSYKLPKMNIDNETVFNQSKSIADQQDLANGTVTEKLKEDEFDDVAIIGISLDFPNNCCTLESLENILYSQQNTCSEAPWDSKEVTMQAGIADEIIQQRISKGHFLSGKQMEFDGSQFGISPSESVAMHITQKVLLKNAYSALEDSGYVHGKICTNTGVFIGIGGQAEALNQLKETIKEQGIHEVASTDDSESDEELESINPNQVPDKPSSSISAYSATSSTTSVAAGRISYCLGLQGPCMAIDTACSSSLVALHAARRSLQMNECDMAIVCGINIIDVWTSMACAVAGMNSTDGLCRTFDARAAGYARSEGCGAIILKRTKDCKRDADSMYAVVKGSAVQQDGKSASLTAPNGLAQQSVIRNALKDANLKASALSFLETHGTGTQYGDPVETAAIVSELRAFRSPDNPLYLTAVKANVGHLEAGAGLAGLFSAIISLHKQEVPPICGLQEVNPIVAKSLQGSNIQVLSTSQSLHRMSQDQRLAAGISSFGYSGTISHVIIEEPEDSHKRLLTFQSNSNSVSTQDVEDDYLALDVKSFLLEEDDVVFAEEKNDSMERAQFHSNSATADLAWECNNMLWQFAGQGSLKVGSGKSLFDKEESVRRHLASCDVVLERCLGVTATDLLYPEYHNRISKKDADAKMQQSKYAQAVLVALEYAQAAALLEQDVRPWAVMGHSLGEYAAIIIAGILTLEESLTLVCERGTIVEHAPGCAGIMLACRSNEAEALKAIAKLNKDDQNKVSVAGINGKASIVLAGEKAALDRLTKQMGIAATIPLGVKNAFHSPLMKAAEAEFRKCLEKVHFKPSTMPFISTVTGKIVAMDEICSVDYWIKHMLQSVRYVDAVESACKLYQEQQTQQDQDPTTMQDPLIVIELGPQNTLTKLCNPIMKSSGIKHVEALACVPE